MKKIISVLLLGCLLLLLVGCDMDTGGREEYRLGLGIVPFIETDAKDSAQFSAALAAVVTDDNGVIIDCVLDAVQNTVSVKGGKIEEDATKKQFYTKQQLGDDYGMKEASSIEKEWYQQADFLSDYVVGMTIKQIREISVDEYGKPKDDVIKAGCTMSVSDYIKAIIEAMESKNSKEFSAESFRLGIGAHSVVLEDSADAVQGKNGMVAFETSVSAAITDSEHKTIALLLDAVEPKIEFDAAGKTITVKDSILFTKKELGYDYGMKNFSPIKKEWLEQAAAFEEYVVGLDGVGINSMKTTLNEENGKVLTDEPELKAGCTIAVDSLMKAAYNSIESID